MTDLLDALAVTVTVVAAVGACLWGYARWLLSKASEDDDV